MSGCGRASGKRGMSEASDGASPLPWFDARRLFGEGVYPEPISSALRVFPAILDEIRCRVAALAPRRALEVGPGDAPALVAVRGAVYLDLVPGFLRGRARAVVGDVRRAPFRSDAFDLVVANDVFTHIPGPERAGALEELVRLAPRLLIFNPEPGTPEVPGSESPSGPLVAALEQAGHVVDERCFVARLERERAYGMALIEARRRPPAPRGRDASRGGSR